MPNDVAAFIKNSAWGSQLDDEALSRVLSAARGVRIEPGQYVVRSGDLAEYWVGLMDGVVIQQVTNAEGKPAILTAACDGTWFGEGTLMKRGHWQYDAVARRETHAALIPYSVFKWLRDTHLGFNQFIARLLNERLAHYMGLLANERLTQVEQRMAHVLASLFDPDLYPDRPPLLRINQTDIALLAGMSRQRANTALHCLQAEGLVEVTRTGIRVLNVQALKSY